MIPMRSSRKEKIYCSLGCNFQGHIAPLPSGCVEWTGKRLCKPINFHYGIIRHRGQEIRAHRFIWEQANGPIPEGMVVLHSCDNPPCVNINHLSVGTQAQNLADAASKKRMPRGSTHSNAKLTEDDIFAIRRMAVTETHAAIAARYGVASQTIDRIVSGQRWGWLKDHQEEPGQPPHQ